MAAYLDFELGPFQRITGGHGSRWYRCRAANHLGMTAQRPAKHHWRSYGDAPLCRVA
jgi:hypothetical protein